MVRIFTALLGKLRKSKFRGFFVSGKHDAFGLFLRICQGVGQLGKDSLAWEYGGTKKGRKLENGKP